MYENLVSITKETLDRFAENNFERVVLGIRSLYTIDNTSSPESAYGVYINYFREFCNDDDVYFEDVDSIINTQFNDDDIYVAPVHSVIRKIAKYTATHIIEYSDRDVCIIVMNFIGNIMDVNHILYDPIQVYNTDTTSINYTELDQYFKNILFKCIR